MSEPAHTISEPEDFDEFWGNVVREVSDLAPDPLVERWENEDPAFEDEYIIDAARQSGEPMGGRVQAAHPPNPFDARWDAHTILTGMTVRRVSFAAPDGQKVGGLLQYPNHTGRSRFPGLVHFTGYGGELMIDQDFVSRGYAVLNFSHRGMYLGSESFDRYRPVPLLVRGIESPDTYVYRAVAADCLAALKVMRSFEMVDPERVGVMGMSQGGALSILTGALDRGLRAVAADLPWLTDFGWQLAHRMEGPTAELDE